MVVYVMPVRIQKTAMRNMEEADDATVINKTTVISKVQLTKSASNLPIRGNWKTIQT